MHGNERFKVEGPVAGKRRDGKNRYDEQARGRLVELCQQPGVSVTAIAVANGLNPNVVRRWMGLAQANAQGSQGRCAAWLPVELVGDQVERTRIAEGDGSVSPSPQGFIEYRIELERATLRFGARLDLATLRLIAEGFGVR